MPVYTTSDEILPMVATICLALLLNAYQTLACVYLPKLYAILFVGDGGMEIDDWRTTIAKTIQQSRVHPSDVGDATVAEVMKNDSNEAGTSGSKRMSIAVNNGKKSMANNADREVDLM